MAFEVLAEVESVNDPEYWVPLTKIRRICWEGIEAGH